MNVIRLLSLCAAAAPLLCALPLSAEQLRVSVFEADAGQDGVLELIVAVNRVQPNGSIFAYSRAFSSDGEIVFEHRDHVAPNADFTADGLVDEKDLSWLLENWGDGALAELNADLNGDLHVDADDLGILLQRFGAAEPPRRPAGCLYDYTCCFCQCRGAISPGGVDERADPRVVPEYVVMDSLELVDWLRTTGQPEQVNSYYEIERRLRACLFREEAAIEALIETARSTSETYEHDSPPVLALRLLGDVPSREAADALIDRLDVETGSDGRLSIQEHRRATRPALDGLLKSGRLAVAPMLERVSTANEEEWELMEHVLARVDRASPIVRYAMSTLREVTEDERGLERLDEFLATPEPRRGDE